MYKTGLCSITFRKFSVDEIIQLVQKAGLDGIEWGGDVHVPADNLENAKAIAEATRNAGLEVASYGSYLRLGDYEENPYTIEQTVETAVALKTKYIRVWAGSKASEIASSEYRQGVISQAREIAEAAAKYDIIISLEYHRNTLTDTVESTLELLEEINLENVTSCWQPSIDLTREQHVNSIKRTNNWLTHIHVFQWDGIERLDLSEGIEEWKHYLSALRTDFTNRYLLLEFVKDDSKTQFFEDVKALKSIVNEKGE